MAHVSSFYVKQKITVMVNQFRVIERLPDGSEGRLPAFAQQKRMSFKEKVFFYADEEKTQDCSRSRPGKVSMSAPNPTCSTRPPTPSGGSRKTSSAV